MKKKPKTYFQQAEEWVMIGPFYPGTEIVLARTLAFYAGLKRGILMERRRKRKEGAK